MGVWLQVEKIKVYLRNLSLRKSMALHIIVFVVLALILGNLTAAVCDRASRSIQEKYLQGKEKYYLTNTEGEQLGEGTYVWKEAAPMPEADKRLVDFLDAFPVIMYPVYSALAVAAAAVLFYRGKLKRPLELLTEASEKIAENELVFSVNYESRDEMGQLCRSFEIMRSALEKNQLEMWRLMEERKRLNAAFAHDLRTPLTVLKGYNEIIQFTGGEQERATANIMAKHITRLEGYADSMSRIRRLEDLEPDYKLLKLPEFLDVLKNSGSIFCEQKGKKFEFISSVYSAQMWLDQELILQAFHNLLSNAARFARERISLEVRERESGLQLTVRDDGEGFSENALRNGLNPYYHETKDTVQEYHFGLGLYICKILCQRHGGYIKISNTGSGAEVNLFFKKVDKK